MNWRFVKLRDADPVPWKNGGGLTRELLILPAATPGSAILPDWAIRLSVADVTQGGPFSRFDGITRWFAVLQGDGVVLDIAGHRNKLNPSSAPLCFDGGAATDCQLIGGATQDFNLMVRGGSTSTHMERVFGVAEFVFETKNLIAIYAGNAGASVNFFNSGFQMEPDTLAWCQPALAATIRVESAAALWMEVAA
jgi:environmental stress-induced protein Ves